MAVPRRRKGAYPWLDPGPEAGFSSLGVVIALSLVLTLVFTSTQVYWINSHANDIQFAADAGALAAENVVAEYYIIARIVDAVILSMTLFGVLLVGVSIILYCIPSMASVGGQVMKLAKDIFKARDDLAKQAGPALTQLQKALPFVAIANAYLTVQANAPSGWRYHGIALLVPFESEDVEYPEDDPEIDEKADEADRQNKQTEQALREAETAKQLMDEALQRGWDADCGGKGKDGQCMFERDKRFNSPNHQAFCPIESWNFGVALNRARNYYSYRLITDKPVSSSTNDRSKYEIRCIYYRYALNLLNNTYPVYHENGCVEVSFPALPTNYDAMKRTSIYTTRHFYVGSEGHLHGTSSCPVLGGASIGMGSLQEMDTGMYTMCPECRMTPSTVGSVWNFTSSDDNRFEKWYNMLADAARDYNAALSTYEAANKRATESADAATDAFAEALELVKTKRIDPHPPGRRGCIVFVVDPGTHSVPSGLQIPLLAETRPLSPRLAISAAALARDMSDDNNILGNFLDRVRGSSEAGAASPAGSLIIGFDVILELWGASLMLYDHGVEGLTSGIRKLTSEAFGGALGSLGNRAADAIERGLKSLGLEPVDLHAPKPVLVNSFHVAKASEGAGTYLVNAKDVYASFMGYGSGTLTDLVFDHFTLQVEAYATSLTSEGITFNLSFGTDPFNVKIPINVKIPESIVDKGLDYVHECLGGVRGSLRDEGQLDVWE